MLKFQTQLAALLVAGCGASSAPPSAPAQPPVSAPSQASLATHGTLPPAAGTALAAPRVASSAAAPLASTTPELKVRPIQVLSSPVRWIALGDGERVALLADPPQVGNAHGFHALPLPAALRAKPGEVDDAHIYFGRDNEPRIMGTRRSSSGETPIYWRHTAAAGWRDGREEIGQLGGPAHSGLWGELGSVDPELVCRSGVQCIIKRQSGWTTAPAGAAERAVVLQDGVVWGLDASGIAGIDAHGWALAIAAPAWTAPRAFWASRAEAWVNTDHELYRFHEAAWTTLPLPFSEVSAWWGRTADSVWLVGNGGIAHFDGHRFRTLAVPGQQRVISGRANGEIWFAGDAGLFRIAPSSESTD